MNCAHLRQVLDAYIDHELDAATSADITQHLAACAECAAARAERDALRREVRSGAAYFSAPDSLRQQVERFSGPPARVHRAVRRPSWFFAGVLAAVAALAGLLAGYWLARPLPDHPLQDQLIASHVASLGDARRLTEVAANDRHVIKPWFQGKVDFAPNVRDLSAEGFTLAGARLDHVADRQAAALVYRIRNHVINVFVWRAERSEAQAPSFAVVRGFGVMSWAAGGLRYAAVSDVDPRDLKHFAGLLAAP